MVVFEDEKLTNELRKENKNKMSSIEDKVINKIETRSKIGLEKYNTSMDRKDLSKIEWLNHLQEELLDASIYVEKLINLENKFNALKDMMDYDINFLKKELNNSNNDNDVLYKIGLKSELGILERYKTMIKEFNI
jgi:hypothetical protein